MSKPITAVVTASSTRNIDALNAYVSNQKPGEKQDRWMFQSGINGADPVFFSAQARRNRQKWNKDGTRQVERGGKQVQEGKFVQGYHVIQSFGREGVGSLDPNNLEDVLFAHEQGIELARELGAGERMATVTTQIDGKTGCIHNHIVLDSISRTDGTSLPSATISHKNLAPVHDEVLKRQGLENLNVLGKAQEKKERSEVREKDHYEKWQERQKLARAGKRDAHGKRVALTEEPFSFAVLKERIHQAYADPRALSEKDFIGVAREYGVDVRLSERGGRRGISYGMIRKDASGKEMPLQSLDRRAGFKVGTAYSRQALDRAIEANQQLAKAVPEKTVEPVEAPKAEAKRVAKPTPARVKPAPKVAKPVPPRTKPESVPATKPVAKKPVEVTPQPVFKSELRSVRATGNLKTVVSNLATFEESVVRDGKPIVESRIPRGVTPEVLQQVGDKMEPSVREVLSKRATKLDQAREEYKKGKLEESRAVARQEKASVDDNEHLQLLAEEHMANSGAHFATAKQMRSEVKRGDYEIHSVSVKPERSAGVSAEGVAVGKQAESKASDWDRARALGRSRSKELPSR